MFCSQCGKPVSIEDKFCRFCGAKVNVSDIEQPQAREVSYINPSSISIPLTDCTFSYRKKVGVTINKKTGKIVIIPENGCYEFKNNTLIIYRRPEAVPVLLGGLIVNAMTKNRPPKLLLSLNLNHISDPQIYKGNGESALLLGINNGNKLAIVGSDEHIEMLYKWASLKGQL